MIMIMAIVTAADLTNIDTLIERPSCTICVSEMSLDKRSPVLDSSKKATSRWTSF